MRNIIVFYATFVVALIAIGAIASYLRWATNKEKLATGIAQGALVGAVIVAFVVWRKFGFSSTLGIDENTGDAIAFLGSAVAAFFCNWIGALIGLRIAETKT
jgi:hypothetical protein